MIKKIINGVLAALICSLMVTIVASCAVDDTPISAPQPTVVCNNGVFIGKQVGHVMAYKGIPYALPPVGALRWKAPVAMADGDKVIDATEFGLSCR